MTVAARRSIDNLLAAARARLDRLTAREAYESVRQGRVLVDIRPESDRRTEGEIFGALVIERNVLEWRLDPTSDTRLPIADYDLPVVVFCNEGYTSSLAAVASRISACTAPPTSSADSAPGVAPACPSPLDHTINGDDPDVRGTSSASCRSAPPCI